VITEVVGRYLPPPTAAPANVERLRQHSLAMSQERLASICSSLALRDLNLVDSVIDQLERLYEREDDPDTLGALYQIDNLAIRLRRNAENLRVLAGQSNDDAVPESASLVDLLRAALSSIRQHDRVALGQIVSVGVVGPVAADIGRALTELLDNGANNSPPNSQVRASAHLTEQGSVLVRIEDDGIGLSADQLGTLNRQLSSTPVLDRQAVTHMGLAVVAQLAYRHKLRVQLTSRIPQGTTVLVTIPAALICELPTGMWSGGSTVAVMPHPATPRTTTQARTTISDRIAIDRAAPPRNQPAHATPADPIRPKNPRTPPKPRPTGGSGDPASTTSTPTGLPRRVPGSLRAPTGSPSAEPESPRTPAEVQAGHEQLLADLGAFDRGLRAARQDRTEDTAEAGRQPDEPEGQQP
jgi:hypothetical protein